MELSFCRYNLNCERRCGRDTRTNIYEAGVNRDFMDLSPGWVLLSYVLQWCCENKRYEFDFMRGDEEYKYRFGAVNQYVMRARIVQ